MAQQAEASTSAMHKERRVSLGYRQPTQFVRPSKLYVLSYNRRRCRRKSPAAVFGGGGRSAGKQDAQELRSCAVVVKSARVPFLIKHGTHWTRIKGVGYGGFFLFRDISASNVTSFLV